MIKGCGHQAKPSDSTVVDSRTWICREDAAPSSQPSEPPCRAETSVLRRACRHEPSCRVVWLPSGADLGWTRTPGNQLLLLPPTISHRKQTGNLNLSLLCRLTMGVPTLQRYFGANYTAENDICRQRDSSSESAEARVWRNKIALKTCVKPGLRRVRHAHRPAPLFICFFLYNLICCFYVWNKSARWGVLLGRKMAKQIFSRFFC